jgi:chlorobactene glucosyltransferase
MMRHLGFWTHATAILLLSVFSYRLWRNLQFLSHARKMACFPDISASVSVLVPARDEAATIASCIESLASQVYPRFEVIVLNDHSSDQTGTILDGLATRHLNVTVLHGSGHLPAGWNGKSYACQRLADQATGEWLLFTDADTVHTPASIAQGIALAEGLQVDLLSAFPRQLTRSWSERVVVSFILDFLPLAALDLRTLWRSGSGRTAANGQYLLIRTSTYRAVGGHNSISHALVDDFALAKRVRCGGFTVALVDGTSMLSCRMYRNAREVWEGFSKNVLAAMDTWPANGRRSWWRVFFAWSYACVFVIPFYELLFARDKRWPLLKIAWLGLLRGVVNWQFTRPFTEVLTTPLAAWSVMALGLQALFRHRRGKHVVWKGRKYTVRT